MKKIVYLSIIVCSVLSTQETQCSSFFNTKWKKVGAGIVAAGVTASGISLYSAIEEAKCIGNCQRMQEALTVASERYCKGQKSIPVEIPTFSTITPNEAMKCKDEFDRKNPEPFKKSTVLIILHPEKVSVKVACDPQTTDSKKPGNGEPFSI